MPYSYTHFDQRISSWIRERYRPGSRFVDLGCGAGKYGKLLGDDYVVDGVEVFEPYIGQFGLLDIYRNVELADVRRWVLTAPVDTYRLAILGDVLEHLSAQDARDLLAQLWQLGMDTLVAVPYLLPQGAVGGNVAETHLQPDLTPEVVGDRFSRLRLLLSDAWYAIYFAAADPATNP